MIGPAAFSIRVAARMTGLSPELLRAWERRHAVVTPERARNGRRLYSRGDVDRLRLVKAAVDAGHPIGNVHALAVEELRGLTAVVRTPVPGAVEEVLALDPEAMERRLDYLAATLSPAEFVLQLAGPLQGRPLAGPAALHICAALLRTLRRPGDPDLLVAGDLPVAGDLLLPAVLAAARGKKVLYLGPAQPHQVAAHALQAATPVALVHADDEAFVEALLKELPPQVQVWLMGAAADRAPPQVTPLYDLDELDRELA